MKINPNVKNDLKAFLDRKLAEERNKVIIVSSYKLKETDLKIIFKRFPFLHQDNVKNIIDDKLIGGVVIKFGTKVIDLSLKKQLEDLKKKLYEIN